MAKKTPQDATPQDAPSDFDIDAWLEDASIPEDSVTVVGKGSLKAEHKELEAQLVRLRADGLGDTRLVDPAAEIAARLRDIEREMRDSEVTFRFRQLTSAEIKDARASAPKDEGGEPDSAHVAAAVLAASCVSPRGFTVEHFLAMPDKIGEPQYEEVWSIAWGLCTTRKVDVPKSLAASVTLRSKGS